MHNVISFIFMISTILASIGLIIIIYSRNSEKYSSRLFIMTLILVIAYVISHGLHFFMLSSEDVTILDQSCHSLLLLIVVSLTFYSISFVRNQKVGIFNSILILIPTILLLVLLWTGNLVNESHYHIDLFEAHYDKKYPIFLIWYLVLIFYAFYHLTVKFISEQNRETKNQILILSFGLLLTNLTTFVFGLFLPWILGFYYLVEISPLAFLVGLILFTTIGVGRYNMFPNILVRVHSFSLNRKIFLSSLIAVPIVIVMIQIPLGRVLFGINTPEAWTKYFFISLLGGGIVSLTISFIILKIIANPIEKLRNQALEIQKGIFGIEVDINSNDEIGELAYTFNDMTQKLKNDSEEIKQKEYRINMLLDAFDKSFTSIALVDNSFRIIQANNMFCKINFVNRTEILNKAISEVQFKGSLINNYNTIVRTLDDDKTFKGELTIPQVNGELKTFLISVTQFDLSQSELKGFLFVEIDISHVKELEAQLINAEKFAAIGKMSAVLAHEIKTPLTSIKMNADILSSSLVLNDEDKQSFTIINKEINRLNNLVKEILEYSRQSELNYSTFDLSEIINTIKKSNSNKYLNNNFNIVINIAELKINADREKLYQVFLNLIENSFDSAGSNGWVKFESKNFNENIIISVSDNGKGISKDYKEKVFEAFFTSKSSGTGLGLSICKKIIEQHGGNIKLSETKGVGTTFEISLPISLFEII